MPWPVTQRATTRQMILDSAARIFALEGFEKVSIDTIMESAGLTRGAFYSHFASKTELYTEAIRNAANAGGAILEEAGKDGLQQVVKDYLRMDHRDASRMHCPLAFMVNDAAQQDGAIQESYTQVLAAFITRLESGLKTTTETNTRQHALQIAVGMIGGLALARAVADDQLAQEILTACQQGCLQLVEP